MKNNLIRKINDQIVKYYDLNINDLNKINIINICKNGYILDNENEQFFIKKTSFNTNNKYEYLANIGINNLIYPKLNYDNKYTTKFGIDYYYVSNYIKQKPILDEMRVLNLYKSLRNIHENTAFKRKLSPSASRSKFEEITKQLDNKFIIIEDFIKSVEARPLNEYSMPILSNYRYIIDCKNELIRLQKRIISAIKDRITIDYSFIHNNPKLDHLIIYNGNNYLTSIENSKLGISSLDMAKLYIESESLNIDFKSFIVDYYFVYENLFYYDYFRFLILFIYIKRLVISKLDYTSATSFINISKSIKKYFTNFLDKEEKLEDDTENE